MHNLFNIDSPLMKKIAMFVNIVIVNILWLLCSVPIITIGASTTALYYTAFINISDRDDEVIKPFFRTFRKEFKRSTLLWLPLLALIGLIVLDIFFLLSKSSQGLRFLWFPVIILAFVAMIIYSQAFPQLARFESTIKQVLKNSFILFLMVPVAGLIIIIVNLFPVLLLLLRPDIFIKTAVYWTMCGFSLCAYINAWILLHRFYIHNDTKESSSDMD